MQVFYQPKSNGRSQISPRRRSRIPLMNLDRRHYAELNDRELTLLSRFAVLTKNGTQPCNYTNEQALKEFGLNGKTVQRAVAYLKQANLIDVLMDYKNATQRGYKVRTIILTSPLVVFRKETPNA